MRFVLECLRGELSMAELCRTFGISRRVGYKWLRRYRAEGVEGLQDRSRAPHSHPNAVPPPTEQAILAARRAHPTWGPKKLRAWLRRQRAWETWPAASTIGEILTRHGLTVPRRRRHRTPPQTEPFRDCDRPNRVWCIDFKGWFRTGDGARCDPLTITDAHSRYLLRCQALIDTSFATVQGLVEAAFRQYGLPEAIRSDNGSPFASRGIGGFSRLSVWWLKLGIVPERIQPGQPQQNGRHERMHLTLKQETAQPPMRTLRGQQRRFDRFRREFNEDRPHEALGMRTPSSVYEPSPRRCPPRPADPVYAEGLARRRVKPNGVFNWHNRRVFLGEAFGRELVGLERLDDRHWRVRFGGMPLAILDDRAYRLLTPLECRRRGFGSTVRASSFRCAPGTRTDGE
jgi:transposase InsO family protein